MATRPGRARSATPARTALRSAVAGGRISMRAARTVNRYLARGTPLRDARSELESIRATPAQRRELNAAFAVALRASASARGATVTRARAVRSPTE